MRELTTGEEGQADVLPGFTVHGMDIGKWLARQRKLEVWATLTGGQCERLEQLTPLAAPAAVETDVPAEPSMTPVSAFERGVARWAQYKKKARTGSLVSQGPRRAAGGRDRGEARRVPQQEPPDQADRRQARRAG
ncbi:helicase associated domain-containing protein (plasmid) [Streptomyces sp. KN37]|nr:helicase associated domain-containing protein [Streptomyces sp. KN37]WPO76320.1 helicase associated domain-containing protein [Streptomyces sp. KN37]